MVHLPFFMLHAPCNFRFSILGLRSSFFDPRSSIFGLRSLFFGPRSSGMRGCFGSMTLTEGEARRLSGIDSDGRRNLHIFSY